MKLNQAQIKDSVSNRRRSIEGEFYGVVGNKLIGWVRDLEDPIRPVLIEVLINSKYILQTLANRAGSIPSLKENDLRTFSYFAFQLPKEILAIKGSVVITVRTAIDHIQVGEPLTIHKRAELQNVTMLSKPKIKGYVDKIEDGHVVGWAMDENSPLLALCLRVVVASRTVGVIYADQYRADLYSAGFGDGCHGFSYKLPSFLFTGETHTVQIVENETGIELVNGFIEIGVFKMPSITSELNELRVMLNDLTQRLRFVEKACSNMKDKP